MRIFTAAVFLLLVLSVHADDEMCDNGGATYHGACSCPSYFNGTLCQDLAGCANNGTLSADGKSCTCPPGFNGRACQFAYCKSPSGDYVVNDYKRLVLIVETSTFTQKTLTSLSSAIESIFDFANAAHNEWFGSTVVYAMYPDGSNSTKEFSEVTQAADFLKILGNEATQPGLCTLPVWESLNDIFILYPYMERSQFVLITSAIPQVNGTDFTYAKHHFTAASPYFDFIHVENPSCPLSSFRQNYTEFVNFAISFNGIFLRAEAADVAQTLRTILLSRYVAQRISLIPHLPDINCTGETLTVQVDSQTTNIYVTVAGTAAAALVTDPSGKSITTDVLINSAVQKVWHFSPSAGAGTYSVKISSGDASCFPVVYSDGIQIVVAFTEKSDSDTVLDYPLRVFDDYPVFQQHGRADALGTLKRFTMHRYYLQPPTDWVVSFNSPITAHNNCSYNFIAEDFDRLTDGLYEFTITGVDSKGFPFTRSISSWAKFYDGPNTSTTQRWTTNSTAPSTATVATVTTITPSPSPSSPSIYCSCPDSKRVWVDVVFLIDSSVTMGLGKSIALSAVQDALKQLNLQVNSSGRFYTRAAVIGYGDSAQTVIKSQVVRDFSNLTELSDIQSLSLPTYTSNVVDIPKAVNLALATFSRYNLTQRANTKKVIVLVGGTFSAGSYLVVNSFKENGGVFVVADYTQSTGQVLPGLEDLASPGYFLQFDNSARLNYKDLIGAFCDANCFCPSGYSPFANNNVRNIPDGGCYLASKWGTSQPSAENDCKSQYGCIATVHDQNKEFFLMGLFPARTKYWIGYKKINGTNQWVWDDKSTDPYTNWSTISNPDGGCAVAQQTTGFRNAWDQADCFYQSFLYACQTKPCDSTYYCF